MFENEVIQFARLSSLYSASPERSDVDVPALEAERESMAARLRYWEARLVNRGR